MLQLYKFDAATPIQASGNFFKYESVLPGASDDGVRVRANGQDLGVYYPGDAVRLPFMATSWDIAPLANAVGTLRIGAGDVVSTRVVLAGQMNSTVVVQRNTQVDPTNTAKTVTTTSGTLVAANPNRQYLLVQNKHVSGQIWLKWKTGVASQANGFRIGPGGYWEWDSTVPISELQAIGDVASNPDVVVVEG